MTKKISKVIVYYEDGTYEEIKTSTDYAQNKPHTPDVSPSTITPYQPKWVPQYTRDTTWPRPITCGPDSGTYKITSTNNLFPDNKYSITSTGNGNVEISR